jgi:hypothetical protein
MKARWIIVALLCLAVGALVTYIARNTYWDDIALPAPLRGEAVTNPFYASQKFAEALGATTEWRRTLGTLPSGDVVVVLSHWHWDLIEDRRQQLEDWVNAGGRVVIDRTLIGGDEHLESWAGIRREYPGDEEEADDEDATAEEENVEAESDEESIPVGELCATLHTVDSAGERVANGRELGVCKLDGFSHLTTDRDIAWGLDNDDGVQVLRVKVGRGSVTSINADPFGNRDLMQEDHGELFVTASQLRRGDRVIFISEREHTSLLGLIWLHGAPVVVLFLIVLAAILWRGGIRFGPLSGATDTARRSIAEQIRGTGQFTIRLGGGKALHAATVRALQEAATRRIAQYSGLAHTERVAAIAHTTGIDADTLAQAINHGGARRPGELAQTIATLETARRKILDHRP